MQSSEEVLHMTVRYFWQALPSTLLTGSGILVSAHYLTGHIPSKGKNERERKRERERERERKRERKRLRCRHTHTLGTIIYGNHLSFLVVVVVLVPLGQ